jgi:hypothetical protein
MPVRLRNTILIILLSKLPETQPHYTRNNVLYSTNRLYSETVKLLLGHRQNRLLTG